MPYELPEEALSEMSRVQSPRDWKSRLGDATTYSFLAASGPGGQNVNKVATACQLRCDVFALGLPPFAYHRLKELAGSRMTEAGERSVAGAMTFRTFDVTGRRPSWSPGAGSTFRP